MKHEIAFRPSYSLLKIQLNAGETLTAEAGAMVSMSSGIDIETTMRGGLLGALKRSLLGGESFFINTFKAATPGEVTLAPSLPGDITHVALAGQPFYAQSGAFIASSPTVEVDTKWGGGRTFFSGEGFFLLKLTGTGSVFLSSYGAIDELTLGPGQTHTVDTGHVVGFSEGVNYEVSTVGGLKSTVLGGEGLVVKLTGPGKVLIQTRSVNALLSWLIPRLPRPEHR